jgi:lipopolysaccharide/colanic/teichoic acid biosynthesis glycosyltransferase
MTSGRDLLVPHPTAQHAAARRYVRYGKPLFDLALLLVAGPPALLVAAPIALLNACVFRSLRRVLFLQQRVGRAGRVYTLVKFRTMREARGGAFESWQSGSEQLRVTRFGRWLRNTHLDELPQVWNVVRGEMSFIGPRPEMVEIEAWAEAHVPGFGRRLALKPGLTGLAQITQGYAGQDVAAYAEKLRINEQYLQRVSLRTDLGILVRTVAWMLRGRGWQWKRQGSAVARPASTPEHVLVPAPRRASEPAREALSSARDDAA